VDIFAEFQRLVDESSGNPDANPIVDLLLAGMEPTAAHHLRLCAIPHQFDLPIFRLLAPELDPGTAERRFEELSRLSLVIRRDSGFALHDEPRRYLFQKWLKEHRREFILVNATLVKFFRDVQAPDNPYAREFAARKLMFHLLGSNLDSGLQEFESLSIEARAKGRLTECEALITLCREYETIFSAAQAGLVIFHEAELWFKRREWTKSEELYNSVLSNAAVKINYHIQSWSRIGLTYLNRRDWSKAIDNLKEGLCLAQSHGDRRLLPFIFHDLGVSYRESGANTEARSVLKESIECALEVGDISCIAAGYNSLGTLERRIGNLKEAIVWYRLSIKELLQLGEQNRTAQVYNNLGAAYFDAGEWKASEEMYKNSLALKTAVGDTIGRARTQANLVPVYQNLGRSEESILTAREAIAIFEELRDLYSAAVTTRNAAKLYRDLNRQDDAEREYVKAMILFRKAGDKEQAIATQMELASYSKPVGLPWWAWGIIIVSALTIAGIVTLIIWLMLN
jgi:tetratricopeptide (TPR) repeat protein